jgi:hypothetical protein
MSRNFEKQMARIMPKQSKSEYTKSGYFDNFKKPWYLDGWFSKTIFILGFFCILWKIFDIVILGRWI